MRGAVFRRFPNSHNGKVGAHPILFLWVRAGDLDYATDVHRVIQRAQLRRQAICSVGFPGFHTGIDHGDIGQRRFGLDIDALRIVSEGVNTLRETDGAMGVLLITHYKRILEYLKADFVHVMLEGRIGRDERELDLYELALKASGAVQASRWARTST